MRGVIRTLTPQTPGVSTLRIDVPLTFKPGQSIQLQIPGDSKKRFFSVSSSPTEGHFIDITLKAPDESPLAQTLVALKRGDAIEVEGPFGHSLTLPDPMPETVCFIAAGTGVTPFRAIIKSLLDSETTTDLWLLHSVKTRAELIFRGSFPIGPVRMPASITFPRSRRILTITGKMKPDASTRCWCANTFPKSPSRSCCAGRRRLSAISSIC